MRGNDKNKTYWIIGAVILLLVFLRMVWGFSWFGNFVHAIFNPVVSSITKTRVALGDDFNSLRDPGAATFDLAVCRKESESFSVLQANLKLLSVENEQLKKQLNFRFKSPSSLIVAEVVGRDIINNGQLVIINRGAKDGVEVGEPVITESGVLVGKIYKVEADISFMRLINDYQSKVGATILNRDSSLGVVEGGYGISLLMQFIPRDETVMVGDQIVTSGLEGGVPRGLLIGSVAVVENEAYKPFQQAILTPATDLSKLTIVSVIGSK